MMRIRMMTGLVGTVAAATISQGALASTAGTVMPVTAITVNACAVAATPLVFGTLNQLNGSPNDSQTTVVVTCTPGTTYDVGMDNGLHASGGVRRMAPTVGASVVPYALYTNATRTTAWGNTVGTSTVSGTATITPATLTVYGRVPAGFTPVIADAYADVVTVTVTF